MMQRWHKTQNTKLLQQRHWRRQSLAVDSGGKWRFDGVSNESTTCQRVTRGQFKCRRSLALPLSPLYLSLCPHPLSLFLQISSFSELFVSQFCALFESICMAWLFFCFVLHHVACSASLSLTLLFFSLSLSLFLFAWWATAKHIYKLLFAWPSTIALHFCSGSFHASSILLLFLLLFHLLLVAPFASLLIAVGQLCQPVWPVDWLATRSFVANVDCSSATAAAASTWTLTSIDWNSCSCFSALPRSLSYFSSSRISFSLSLSSICFSLWLALAVNFYLDFTVSRFSYKFCNSCRAPCPVLPLPRTVFPSLNAIYNISSPFGFRSVQQPQLSKKKNAPLVNCAQFIMRALKAFVAIGRGNCRPTGRHDSWTASRTDLAGWMVRTRSLFIIPQQEALRQKGCLKCAACAI